MVTDGGQCVVDLLHCLVMKYPTPFISGAFGSLIHRLQLSHNLRDSHGFVDVVPYPGRPSRVLFFSLRKLFDYFRITSMFCSIFAYRTFLTKIVGLSRSQISYFVSRKKIIWYPDNIFLISFLNRGLFRTQIRVAFKNISKGGIL